MIPDVRLCSMRYAEAARVEMRAVTRALWLLGLLQQTRLATRLHTLRLRLQNSHRLVLQLSMHTSP